MTVALLLVTIGLLAAAYLACRPGWKRSGPYLPDAYLIGVFLYLCGACVVAWTMPLAHGEDLMVMSCVAMISSLSGSAAFSAALTREYQSRVFVDIHAGVWAAGWEAPAIKAAIAISSLVCILFVYMLVTSPIISQFLTIDAIVHYSSLSFARNAVASGSAGYAGPGFVKQFRDVLLPISVASIVVLYRKPFRTFLFWGATLVTIATMLINGQRSTIIVFILVVWICSHYAGRMRSSGSARRSTTLRNAALVALIAFGFWTLLTAALGRQSDRDESLLDIPIDVSAALVDRVVTTLPRENTQTYPIWHALGPTSGKSWSVSLGTIFKTNAPTDSGLARISNVLSAALGGGGLGDSPLGLPPDLWLAWGWTGLVVVPALYAFFLGFLDLFFLSERSVVFFVCKVYLFIALPMCVSPYTFILNGGAVCIALAVLVKITNMVRGRLPRKTVLLTHR